VSLPERSAAPGRTALVTGAAGFIGSHLIEYLIATGWRVRGLDDFSTGRPEHLRRVASSPDFDLVEASVLDEQVLRAAAAGVTHVFHLASRVGATYVEQHPEETVLDTIQGTRTILAVAGEARVPVFFASTSEIYGDSDAQPLSEDADIIIPPPANPRSSYAFGKGVGEVLVNAYLRRERGPAVIGRLFNTIGPRQSGRYGQVVPRFIGWALANQPLIVHGTGDQTRSFTSVTDSVRAITATLTSPDALGHTINIGGSEEISIIDLAHLVMKLTRSSSTLQHEPYDSVHGAGARDIRRRVPDTVRLRTLARYECTTPLETVLHMILEHEREPATEGAG
jgi:UDP-glucose 4-epimerase